MLESRYTLDDAARISEMHDRAFALAYCAMTFALADGASRLRVIALLLQAWLLRSAERGNLALPMSPGLPADYSSGGFFDQS